MFNQSCMCKVWDRTQNYISVYPHTRQAFPLHKTQGPYIRPLQVNICIPCHRRGVRSYGKLPSRQLQRVTYPGEIQLRGYNILLEDNQTFRTLLTLMIPAQQKHCQCKIPRGTICQAFVWDFLFVRHIMAEPSNWFNSINQPYCAQNINILHKNR